MLVNYYLKKYCHYPPLSVSWLLCWGSDSTLGPAVSGPKRKPSDILSYTRSDTNHTYLSLTLTHQHANTRIFFLARTSQNYSSFGDCYNFWNGSLRFPNWFEFVILFIFFFLFFFFSNCEPFHIASLLQKSTCFLEIQIVIDKTNITYMNLNV